MDLGLGTLFMEGVQQILAGLCVTGALAFALYQLYSRVRGSKWLWQRLRWLQGQIHPGKIPVTNHHCGQTRYNNPNSLILRAEYSVWGVPDN